MLGQLGMLNTPNGGPFRENHENLDFWSFCGAPWSISACSKGPLKKGRRWPYVENSKQYSHVILALQLLVIVPQIRIHTIVSVC